MLQASRNWSPGNSTASLPWIAFFKTRVFMRIQRQMPPKTLTQRPGFDNFTEGYIFLGNGVFFSSSFWAFLFGCMFLFLLIPTLLKMEFEGGVVLKFHFKISFLQSCFLNDQYSSSFHVIGKQVKIKYLRFGAKHLSDWSSTCVGMASLQKIALPWSYLRLAPPELSASIF